MLFQLPLSPPPPPPAWCVLPALSVPLVQIGTHRCAATRLGRQDTLRGALERVGEEILCGTPSMSSKLCNRYFPPAPPRLVSSHRSDTDSTQLSADRTLVRYRLTHHLWNRLSVWRCRVQQVYSSQYCSSGSPPHTLSRSRRKSTMFLVARFGRGLTSCHRRLA